MLTSSYQLYSSRNFPPLAAQLPVLRAMGYDAVEPWLPAYGEDPAGFRRSIDASGLRCHGFHMPLSGLVDETSRFIDIALTLGAGVMIVPWIAPEDRPVTAVGWQDLGAALARGAAAAAAQGLQVAWHNHDFEYVPLPDGSRPIDHILAAPDVMFEIDIGWVTRAGADPLAELTLYADRIVAVQCKDMAAQGTQAEDGWTATGDGIIDWAALLPAMRATRATHVVAEHDNPADWQRFAARSLAAMHALGLTG